MCFLWSCLWKNVPASVWKNKSLNTESVTKQIFQFIKLNKILTYEIDSPEKELNKKLFAKADTLVEKVLSCPHIKLSSSQTLILDGVETVVILSDFAQQLRSKKQTFQKFTLLYLALLVNLQLYFWIKMPKPKAKEAGSLQKLNKRSCKDSTHKVVLLLTLCALKLKRTTNQFQRCDNFHLQNLRTQNLLLLRVNSWNRRHFPDSKLKFGLLT